MTGKAKGKGRQPQHRGGEGSESRSLSPSSRPARARKTPSASKSPTTSKSSVASESSSVSGSSSPLKISSTSKTARSRTLPRPRTSERHTPARDKHSVAIVGAGRLGTALALALDACGYEVRALVSRTSAQARRGAARAGVETLGLDQLDELPQVEILFLTTPDDAVAETAARMSALPRLRAQVALHASGALSSEALAPLRARGLHVGSLHPLAAVSKDAGAGAESLRRAFYCVEGDAGAVRAARRVVRELGGRSFTIEPHAKALYHAAAVMTAGHVVALFDVALNTLHSCGLSERRAREVLLPLLQSTVENLSAQSPAHALTGSFARADVETVRKHLGALRSLPESDALRVYAVLGEHSLKLAVRAGADAAAAERIRRAMSAAFAFERDEDETVESDME